MKKIVSFITVGHSPREDIVDEMREYLSKEIEIRQRGALDEFSVEEITKQLKPDGKEAVMTSRLSNGEMMDFSKAKVMPLLQNAIDQECEAGASVVVIICTNKFDPLQCSVPLIVPYDLLHAVVPVMKGAGKVGALFPFEAFSEEMRQNWMDSNVELYYQCANPKEAMERKYIDHFKEEKIELLLLDCIGYTYECRKYYSDQLMIPIVHPRSMIVHVVHSLLGIDKIL